MFLKDKLIFITGAGTGIGYATAEACAKNGATLIIAGRRLPLLKKAVQKLKSPNGGTHYTVPLDVSDRKAVEKCAGWVKKQFGSLDGLVNCAGVAGPVGTMDTVDPDGFAETININLLGTAWMCRSFFPLLKKTKGRIVNFSGGGGTGPFPFCSAYAVSKAAVVRLGENLAEEYKSAGIEVNTVAPGLVKTELSGSIVKKIGKFPYALFRKMEEQMKEGATPPEHGAALTVFLLSDQAKGISGKIISASWDPWKTSAFTEGLKKRPDFCTVRRIDGTHFKEI